MTKIFATGVTGYIGGDALYAISEAHPDYEITALVRNSDKGAKVAKVYPSIRLVYGDLDSSDLITAEAQKADIVLHCANADHPGAAEAIVKGLAAQSKPTFLIHTSGTGILLYDDFERLRSFGEKLGEKVFDDLEGVSEVTSLPDASAHREVDKIILEAGTTLADKVKTAIVCPPTIYGKGRGPDNQRSQQVPELAHAALKTGQAIRVNQGQTYWGHVHVHDLSALFLKLVEEAAVGGSTAEWPGKPATWGSEGYYFCENGEHIWGEVSQWIADEAHKQGLIKTSEVRSVTPEEAKNFTQFDQASWSSNSRARAVRAREVLKWEPKGASLQDTIKEIVEAEAEQVKPAPTHAEIAAGEK